jgi:hypothetical protein
MLILFTPNFSEVFKNQEFEFSMNDMFYVFP